MKVMFEVHCSMTDALQELNDKMTENFQRLTGGPDRVTIGYKIGSLTIDIPDGGTEMDEKKLRQKSEEALNDAWAKQKLGGKVWLIKNKEA